MPSPRVTVLVPMSRAQRARLRRKAKTTGLSIAELLRRGGEPYTRKADRAAFDHLARDVIRATDKAIQSIETTLALVAPIGSADSSIKAFPLGPRCGQVIHRVTIHDEQGGCMSNANGDWIHSSRRRDIRRDGHHRSPR